MAEVTRQRRQRRFPLLAVLLVVALAVVLGGLFPFRQLLAQDRQVELAREQLAVLQEENARLEDSVAALHTPGEIERLAREQYGLVRPGEISFVVVSPDEPVAEEPPPPEPVAEPPWWDKLWEFLTGEDLVDAP